MEKLGPTDSEVVEDSDEGVFEAEEDPWISWLRSSTPEQHPSHHDSGDGLPKR